MRAWQVERRKRTRHLIELGGLVLKAELVDLTNDDRTMILGALLWVADKLKSDQGERARALWAAMGKQAFDADAAKRNATDKLEADTDRIRENLAFAPGQAGRQAEGKEAQARATIPARRKSSVSERPYG